MLVRHQALCSCRELPLHFIREMNVQTCSETLSANGGFAERSERALSFAKPARCPFQIAHEASSVLGTRREFNTALLSLP